MARIRTVKPEFWTNDQIMECSLNARLMFIGLWNFCDDKGRIVLKPKSIKAKIFPADDISSETISGMIQELSTNDLITIYTVEEQQYLQVTGWHNQRIDKPQQSKLPAPVEDGSEIVPRTVGDGEEGKGKDSKGGDSESSLRSDSASPQNAEQTFEPIPFSLLRPLDYQLALFDLGLPWLAETSGRQAAGLRSMLVKWLKLTGGDAEAIFRLMQAAERQGIGEPVAWIEAALKPKPPTPLEAAQERGKDLEAAGHG